MKIKDLISEEKSNESLGNVFQAAKQGYSHGRSIALQKQYDRSKLNYDHQDDMENLKLAAAQARKKPADQLTPADKIALKRAKELNLIY